MTENIDKQFKSFNPVDKYLFTAMMIYHITEVERKPVWFGKLVESLQDYMSKIDVSASLDTLMDWFIIKGEYGPTGDGRASYLYFIDTWDGGDFRIKKLHDKYWEKITGEKNEG